MAFKTQYRGTRRRTSSRKRGPSTATLQRTKARKKYNWVPGLDSICRPAWIPPHTCAEADIQDGLQTQEMDCLTGTPTGNAAQPIRLELLAPAAAGNASTSQSAYEIDDVTIARIVGHVKLIPTWHLTARALTIINGLTSAQAVAFRQTVLAERLLMFRAGLKKDQWVFDPVSNNYTSPIRDPLNTESWTDGQWSKFWTKDQMYGEGGTTAVQVSAPGSMIGVCSNVIGSGGGGGSSDSFLTDGSGIIDGVDIDPIDISTECQPFLAGTYSQTNYSYNLRPDRPIIIPLSSRKRIRMRENEGLSLWLNYTVPNMYNLAAAACIPLVDANGDPSMPMLGVGFVFTSHVKMLIET